MQASTSIELGLRERHLQVLRQVRAALPPQPASAESPFPWQPTIDQFFNGFAPQEQLGQARHLLFSAIAMPSRQRHLLGAIGDATRRVGAEQTEHLGRLFEAASRTSAFGDDDARRGRLLAEAGRVACAQLVARLSGLSPEERYLPESLQDCLENLFAYVQRHAHFDAVWRQGLLYRALTMAQGAAEGREDEDALRAWADREVEAAWSERVTATAVRWLTDDAWQPEYPSPHHQPHTPTAQPRPSRH